MGACVAALAVVGLAALFLTGCGGAPKSAQTAAKTAALKDPLVISPSQDVAARIRTGEVRTQMINGQLRVAGRVEADETRIARVSAFVTGRITDLVAYEGEPVKRGQRLATIFSTDLSGAQTGFLKATTAQQLADRAVTRARQLLASGVIGEAELQRREAESQQAAADVAAAREHLTELGLSSDAVRNLQATRAVASTIHLTSTIDGIVLDRKATLGQMVQVAEAVFTIADLSSVWLVADVPEQSAGALRVGKPAEAEIPALPGPLIRGHVSFVSSVVNPDTRTVRTRMSIPNPERRFKPAMLATLTLMDGAEPKTVLPLGAVVRENNADHVFIETGPNTFRLRKVTLGDEQGNVRVVVEGVKTGEKIVTDGAFHLNNERNRLLLQAGEGA